MAITEERRSALEIIISSYKLVLSRIPMLPFRWRRALFKSYVENLSDEAFNIYGTQIAETICFTKRDSRRYWNGRKELEFILKDILRLEKHRGLLLSQIRKQRLKYNLKR
ncbi:hypothetical protein LCGC14_0340880 [marine sediment metagenome]|uniref:Uncharacterized protein n=1 Tax=marine sediment metagenome TaxID=412755 RepID=A0A0F9W0Y0_9ZZZZ